MQSLFIDSSSLVKRYRNEEGSRSVSESLENAERLLISRLTIVEVSSALVRRARATTFPIGELAKAIAVFDDDISRSFDVIELDEPVMAQAVAMARKYGLRAADAIQVACAVLARNSQGNSAMVVLSSDVELNAAALSEGLQVVNPNFHP
jgi:uncharacterized protein